MEHLFAILNAPTADSQKVRLMRARVEDRVVQVARRVSTVMTAATQAAIQHMVYNGPAQKKIAGVETRILPASAAAAQELARASAAIIAPVAKQMLERKVLQTLSLRNEMLEHRVVSQHSAADDEDDSRCSSSSSGGSAHENKSSGSSEGIPEDSRAPEAPASRGVNALRESNRFLTLPTDTLFQELEANVSMQRKLLRHSELDAFDRQWGIDPTGEFVRLERVGFCVTTKIGAKETISREIDAVKKISFLKIEKLKLASDAHAGLEILHLFVLDLLGRDTSAARIFEQKSEEDFKRTKVVSGFGKAVAAAVLLVMNIFFAYYSALYGFTKGLAWQRAYLFACITQLFVEIFINETLEVVWMNFFVPTLVAEEVQAVSTSVLDIVQNLCSSLVTSRPGFDAAGPHGRSVFSAADYLFVSTNVAKCYPTIMESFLVQAFTSHLPGELSKKWRIGSMQRLSVPMESNRLWSQLRLNFAFAIAMTVLKHCATAPPLLQRMFIRSAQPFFVSGIIMAFFLVAQSPAYISVFVVAVAAFAAYFAYRYLQGLRGDRREKNMVHPIDASIYEEKEEIVDVQDERCGSDVSSVDGNVAMNGLPHEDGGGGGAGEVLLGVDKISASLSVQDSDSIYDSPSSYSSSSDGVGRA